jgi:Txe/YoeB family toxin of Txe-Axe toxin-antitoxin module
VKERIVEAIPEAKLNEMSDDEIEILAAIEPLNRHQTRVWARARKIPWKVIQKVKEKAVEGLKSGSN